MQFIIYKTYINFQLKLIYRVVEPNVYCYTNKLYTTYTNQLLDYKSTLNSYLHPKRGTINNHFQIKE